MQWAVLGPVEVRVGGALVALGGPKPRSLLAYLAVRANRVVTVDELIDGLWPGRPPGSAVTRVQAMVSGLRRQLAEHGAPTGVIVTRPGGYLAALGPAELDLLAFDDHLAEAAAATAAGGFDGAFDHYRAALRMWRGRPLGDLQAPFAAAEAMRLEERRLGALEQMADAALACGYHAEVLDLLTAAVADQPLRERLRAQLMTVLYRMGRQAEALATCRQGRTLLVEELGVEPGPALRDLEQAILRQDDHLTAPDPAAPDPAGAPGGPVDAPRDDLPRDLADFTGREAEYDLLLRVLDGRTTGIVGIDGMPGVGKTAFAVHAAHRLADRYPDGRHFLDLYGFTPGRAPLDPATALDRLLRTAAGVPGDRVPDGLEERAALWRATLAGRQVLLVLDNAAGAAQVAPLLPGAAGCVVLVTSRRRLADLDGMRPVSLDTLPASAAQALFTAVAGDRALADRDAVADVVRLAGHLPLAIRVAAARLLHRPKWTVRYLAERMRADRAAWPGDAVAAAFAVSHAHLEPAQRRMLHLLSTAPGDHWDRHAAAALAGTNPDRAETLLEELLDGCLLEQPAADRYRFHDLLRIHTRRAAEAEQPDRQAAAARLLDHYLSAAAHATDQLRPGHLDPALRPPAPTTPLVSGYRAALAWYAAEHANLIAALPHADDDQTWRLVLYPAAYRELQGRTVESLQLVPAGLAAAHRLANPRAEAALLDHMAIAMAHTGQADAAGTHLDRALALARSAGAPRTEAHVLNSLGNLAAVRAEQQAATGHYRAAIETYRAVQVIEPAATATGLACTLGNLGHHLLYLGDHTEAAGLLHTALGLSRQTGALDLEARHHCYLGELALRTGQHAAAASHFGSALQLCRLAEERSGEAYALGGLAAAHTRLGQYTQAFIYHDLLLRLAPTLADPRREVTILVNLAETYRAAGDRTAARRHYQQALCRDPRDSPYPHARAHAGLAQLLATTDPQLADTHRRTALALYYQLGLPPPEPLQRENSTADSP